MVLKDGNRREDIFNETSVEDSLLGKATISVSPLTCGARFPDGLALYLDSQSETGYEAILLFSLGQAEKLARVLGEAIAAFRGAIPTYDADAVLHEAATSLREQPGLDNEGDE